MLAASRIWCRLCAASRRLYPGVMSSAQHRNWRFVKRLLAFRQQGHADDVARDLLALASARGTGAVTAERTRSAPRSTKLPTVSRPPALGAGGLLLSASNHEREGTDEATHRPWPTD